LTLPVEITGNIFAVLAKNAHAMVGPEPHGRGA
jgi:hypothetical protein